MSFKKTLFIILSIVLFPFTLPIGILAMYCPSVLIFLCCCMNQHLKEDMINFFQYLKQWLKKTCACCVKFNRLSSQQCQYDLPEYWSNYNLQAQKFDEFVQQAIVNAVYFNEQTIEKIQKSKDKSLAILEEIHLIEKMDTQSKKNLDLIIKLTNLKQYSFDQQCLFGEIIFNGQNPYALKKFEYDPNNQFQKEIYRNFNNIENIVKQDITLPFDIFKLQAIAKSSPQLYLLDYPILRDQFKIEPIKNKHHQQNDIYMHIPYAIFVPVTKNNKKGLVCICSAFKFSQKNCIKVYSPFLKKQSNKLWNAVKMHIGSTHFNEFTISVHLGMLHFKSSRYNVPFYNYFNNIEDEKAKKLFYHIYQRFNVGIQGINLNATSTLINNMFPIAPKSLFFSRSQAIELISRTSQKHDFSVFNPYQLQKRLNLQKLVENDSAIFLTKKLYDILTKFLDQVGNHFGLKIHESELLSDINRQILDKKIENISGLIKNLIYTWVLHHALTFSNLSISSYSKMFPSVLVKPLPSDQNEYDLINQEQFLPSVKTIENYAKLIIVTSISDSENFLLNRFIQIKQEIKDDIELVKIYQQTITSLQYFKQQILIVNEKRLKQEKFAFVWLNPTKIQSSLNI